MTTDSLLSLRTFNKNEAVEVLIKNQEEIMRL
jgi:hypothetical protein